MSLTEQLMADVHDFVSETGMSETALGTRAVRDGSLISRLRAGKSITLRNADRLRAFMAAERAKRAREAPATPGGVRVTIIENAGKE